MLNMFVFNGVSSADFGMVVGSYGQHVDPVPDITDLKIPGRNGNLHLFNGRYNNIKVEYPIIIKCPSKQAVLTQLNGIMNWLLSCRGYARLEDSFTPDYFRKAIYRGNSQITMSGNGMMAKTKLSFDCMPQMFLKEFEEFRPVANGTILFNPTEQPSKPLLKTKGTGYININDDVINVISSESIIIDCENMEVYKEANKASANDSIEFVNSSDFFTLEPGNNTFSTNLSVEMAPMYFDL